MRIAAFNVENLFERARVLNQDEWVDEDNASRLDAGRDMLNAVAKLNALLAQPIYTDADKVSIIELITDLGLAKSDENEFVILRRNRGTLLKRARTGLVITAAGRDSWIGWVELKKEPVNEVATQNTARVLRDVNADIVVVVEAENRISLARFNKIVLAGQTVGGMPYDHIMLVDGNDDRGIDVGLMTRATARIDWIRSHVDDADNKGTIFSRDCPEFHLKLASGERLVVLANHLKSKGFGVPAQSNARRKAQAVRVREIYDSLRAEGIEHIAIAGDFNDTPNSDPLSPLLGNGSDLKDISDHPSFVSDGRVGTYANGTASNKIDYVLLSPALFAKVRGGGVLRKGVWGGVNGTLWEHYPEMTGAHQAASDHAAIYADIDL